MSKKRKPRGPWKIKFDSLMKEVYGVEETLIVRGQAVLHRDPEQAADDVAKGYGWSKLKDFKLVCSCGGTEYKRLLYPSLDVFICKKCNNYFDVER